MAVVVLDSKVSFQCNFLALLSQHLRIIETAKVGFAAKLCDSILTTFHDISFLTY